MNTTRRMATAGALAVLSSLTIGLVVAACSGAQSGAPAGLSYPTSPGDELVAIPLPESLRFGCNDPFVVCVNACTGTLLHPTVAPLVAEGQKLNVRVVGWSTCQPTNVLCTSDNVRNADVPFQPSSVHIERNDGGSGAANEARNAARKALAATPPSTLEDKQALKMAAASAQDPALFDVMTEALDANEPLGVPGLLKAVATVEKARALRGAKNPGPSEQDALQACQSTLDAAIKDTNTALNNVTPNANDFPPSLVHWQAEVNQAVALAQQAIEVYKAAGSAACKTPKPDTYRAALDEAKAARAALLRVEEAASRAQTAALYLAEGVALAQFGDCVMPMPSGDASVTQVVIDVKLSGKLRSLDDGGLDAGSATKDALVYVNVSHGRYYYDVGVLTAFVALGKRTISTPQRPGVAGDTVIALNEQGSQLTGIALNLYPFGHRRETYSFLQRREPGYFGWAKDLLGFQIGFNPNLQAATSTLFGGLVLEPVAGLSLNGGLVILQGDFLQAGYTLGMSPPANRSDYVVQKLMLRGYLGFTLGFELFNTATKRLPASLQPSETPTGE